MSKFGNKSLRRYAMGIKQGVHTASVIGGKLSEYSREAAPLVALAGNEPLALGLEVGGTVGGAVSSLVEKATR